MERRIIMIHVDTPVDVLGELVNAFDEFQLDPDLKIVRLDNAAIYHLIKYDEGEQPAVEPEKKLVSIKSVDINDADTYIERGYTVTEKYAKTVTVEKWEAVVKTGCEPPEATN